ncbi:MAG: molybdopterin-dependent oxidoreductase [Deferribacteraceae bacterium]|jgi:anaerobic dimethyl sulfoxide reductase subunit A|nr:molybdopterin-dependent oxidoreductase [Deferribacteraceae bacterium]
MTKIEMTRRGFMKVAASISVPLVAGKLTTDKAFAAEIAPATPEKVYQVASTFDCGGKCTVMAHVQDGVVTRISTKATDAKSNMPVMRACVRGRAYRNFQYDLNRLKYPMKRVGKRGEGKFQRITWDEATSMIADNVAKLTAKYGPASRFLTVATSQTGGVFSSDLLMKRLFNLSGGFLGYYHSVSVGNTAKVTPYTYGIANSGSSMKTILNSKLVVLWGHNPAENVFGHSNFYLSEFKKKGGKVIVVDPRYSDSAVAYADEWIPLLPTTDNALIDAMAYVIINEKLHNQKFIDTYTIGFDGQTLPEGVDKKESLYAYLFGEKDGIKKTPEWAEAICKVPAAKIRSFAIEYAKAKPAAMIQGWGPQRHSCGERTARGMAVLAILTGNVGIKGGWAGGNLGSAGRKHASGLPIGTNPIKASINIMNWMDAAEDHTRVRPQDGLVGADKLDTNIKMLFSLGGNYMMNQNPNLNKTKALLEDESKIEFIVSHDVFMTPSAKYADLVLPATTFLEGWNIAGTWGSGSYIILNEKSVEPEFERRHDYDWITDVARKMGVEKAFTEGRTQRQWIELVWENTRKAHSSEKIPTFNEMLSRKERIFLFDKSADGDYVAFEQQIKDPKNNKFSTASGKIEIFSKALFDMKNPEIPALSNYVPAWEGPQDKRVAQYPFQLITWKSKNRDNSTFYSIPALKEVYPQVLWINPDDAKEKKIESGDLLRIYNDRGATYIKAEVTTRIMPGVVATPSGAWYSPDEKGEDRNGNVNVLTTDRRTALANGNAHQSILVQIEKA